MGEHRLLGDALVAEDGGIVARCVCGWVSRPYFSSMTASLGYRAHLDEMQKQPVRTDK